MKAQNQVDLREESIKEAIRLYLIKAGRDVTKVEITSVGLSPLVIGVAITEEVSNPNDKNQFYVITSKNKLRAVQASDKTVPTPKPREPFATDSQAEKNWYEQLQKAATANTDDD